MASIENALTQHHKIGIDTSVFIYHFESNAKYLPLTTTILEGIQNGRWRAVTSVITLMEINVHPWRMDLNGNQCSSLANGKTPYSANL